MRSHFRLGLAALSGLTGAAALLPALRLVPAPHQAAWHFAAVALLVAAPLLAGVTGFLGARRSRPAVLASPATAADRDVHGEIVKVVALLKDQDEASSSFSDALEKAHRQLPDSLDPEGLRFVISYLMLENENMRTRTTEMRASLEASQRQIEKLRSNLAAAEAQGLIDPLTTLRNRRGFDLAIAREIAAARKDGSPLCLVLADIDHFKSINDRYGHPAGDEVLRRFARLLSSNVKGRDTVARHGGEEFAIILPQTRLENAVTLAGQIRSQLEARHWRKSGAAGAPPQVTASFGVAQLAAGESADALIRRADAKLYESKANGRNRVAA
jgi:diguanylate cyclase